jgi:hypothetical protein
VIRETSKQAYNEITVSGLLTDARYVVYTSIYHHGPLTAGECFLKMQEDHVGHTIVKGSVCARLTELRRLGVVAEVGKRKCALTGKNAILWQVTNKLPIKPAPTKKIKCIHCKGKGYTLEGNRPAVLAPSSNGRGTYGHA